MPISGETDWTLIDLVADARAPTPTKAAEWAVPVLSDLLERLGQNRQRLGAAQRRTLADAEFYEAQKQAEGLAYQITQLAKADAERIHLTAGAQQEAIRAILSELEGKGPLAEQYIQVLIAQELRENSKWIIGGAGTVPLIDLRETVDQEPEKESTP